MMYKCEKCGKEFEKSRSLGVHKQSCYNKEKFSESRRRTASKQWEDAGDRREAMSKWSKDMWQDDEYRNLKSTQVKEQWKSEEYKKYMADANSKLRSFNLDKWRDVLKEYTDFELLSYSRVPSGTDHSIINRVRLKCPVCGNVEDIQVSHVKTSGVRCSNCYPFASKAELELFDFCSELGKTKKLKRTEFSNLYELDIVVNGNKAFEYNGCFWHSINSKTRMFQKYHSKKVDYFCNNTNIDVYNLWEHWGLEKCKSIILSKLGKVEKIYARKCKIVDVNSKDKEIFFNKYHVDNDTKAFRTYGLEYGDSIVMMLSLRRHPEGIEIARMATVSGVCVVGGFSKLMSNILKDYRENIVSYCDRDLTPDYRQSVYYKYGFDYVGDSGPILKYYNSKLNIVESRQKYQKHKLPGLFEDYDGSVDFLDSKGIYKLYNSGNHKFILNR